MNNKEFIAALADKTGYSLDKTQKLVKTVFSVMGDNFEVGEPILINGFGTKSPKTIN